MSENEPATIAPWRRSLARLLLGFDGVELRNASAHLATLQAEHADSRKSLNAVVEWIKNAEAHIAALQTGYDRLQSLVQRQNDQSMRLLARLALLDSRVGDLERADTAIAAAVSRTLSSDPLE